MSITMEDPPVVLDSASPIPHLNDAEPSNDPFDFDISFISNTPASETVLMCGTGDNCGSSCGSACTTS